MYKKEEFPTNFNEFIGNSEATRILSILKNNCIGKNVQVPPILIDGNPGLGKTTLVQILASELGYNLLSFNGEQFSKDVLNAIVLTVDEKTILFIDEIHSLELPVEELLFHVVQDNRYSYEISKNKFTELTLPEFPIIGATTNREGLSKPLLDRFRWRITLQKYSKENLNDILNFFDKNFGSKFGVTTDNAVKSHLITFSQGVVRLLKAHYLNCLDIAINKNLSTINTVVLDTLMELTHINSEGLDLYQQQYLNYLEKTGRPVGLNAISSGTNIPETTLKIVVEPFLVETGRVIRTPRGRVFNTNKIPEKNNNTDRTAMEKEN